MIRNIMKDEASPILIYRPRTSLVAPVPSNHYCGMRCTMLK